MCSLSKRRRWRQSKASVQLLAHKATLGGMSPDAARHLRHLGRVAAANGTDGTDYSHSYTAKSFDPHYVQRISTACVFFFWGADRILKGTLASRATHTNLRRATA